MNDAGFLDGFTEHLDRLHNLARGLTRSAQDAEDLVSETCVLALRGWRRQPPDDPAAWLATVCLNAARSSYRKRSVRPVEFPEAPGAHPTAACCRWLVRRSFSPALSLPVWAWLARGAARHRGLA